MKKLTLLLFVAILLTSCGPAPQDVVNLWQAALNKGDIDATLSYLAEDATVTIIPPADGDGIYNGHAEIRGWYEAIVAGKGSGILSNCKVDGETITCLSTYAEEGLKAMGVDFIEGSWVAVFRDGKIQSYTFTITPESLAKFPPPPEPTAEPRPEPTSAPLGAPVSGQLAGIWKTSIGQEGAAYGIDVGQYLLKLREDLRWFVIDPGDGFIYVQGYYTSTADQIVFKETGGPMVESCSSIENTYGWMAEGANLTFAAISVDDEKCASEKFFFTNNPFVLQP